MNAILRFLHARSPRFTQAVAFGLGACDAVRMPGDHGMSWADNQDANEAYDRGVNFGYALRTVATLGREAYDAQA